MAKFEKEIAQCKGYLDAYPETHPYHKQALLAIEFWRAYAEALKITAEAPASAAEAKEAIEATEAAFKQAFPGLPFFFKAEVQPREGIEDLSF